MKPGYKQTEVGVIPEEWEVKRFGEVFDYLSTATNSRADQDEDGDAFYIHYGDIHTRFHGHLDFNKETPPRIHRKRCGNADPLRDGDWVMADASEDFDGIGKSIEILCLDGSKTALAGLHTFLLREKRPTFALGFKGHLGALRSLHNEFLRVATGMKVFGVSKAALRDLSLPIPPLPEQRAIATALSDVDALLAAIDRLLAKKRDLKQAAMQQLLTGQTRLPGFEGEWEVKRLEQSCELITKGTTPTSIGKNFTESGINFLKAESLSESGEPIPDKVAYIDTSTHNLLKRSQLKAGDLLISIAGVLGRVGRVSQKLLPANTNQALALIRLGVKSQMDRDFLFYCLRSPMTTKQINDVNVQAAQANISLQNVRDLEIHVPPTLAEQTAIAAVLSDMDAELAALEQRRDKTSTLKQGMMQELLTGRTRLL